MSALTSAQPMMWVKLTLPPRARRRWLLMTIRLSIISFAGMVRTLVAVGIDSDASMFTARVFAMPRSGVTWSSFAVPVRAAARGWSAGIACVFGPTEVRAALRGAAGAGLGADAAPTASGARFGATAVGAGSGAAAVVAAAAASAAPGEV